VIFFFYCKDSLSENKDFISFNLNNNALVSRGRRGRDRMVVGFTTTCCTYAT